MRSKPIVLPAIRRRSRLRLPRAIGGLQHRSHRHRRAHKRREFVHGQRRRSHSRWAANGCCHPHQSLKQPPAQAQHSCRPRHRGFHATTGGGGGQAALQVPAETVQDPQAKPFGGRSGGMTSIICVGGGYNAGQDERSRAEGGDGGCMAWACRLYSCQCVCARGRASL
jgi:hypothetical protein